MELRILDNFEPDNVVPLLKKYMDWRLTDTAGNLLDDRQKLVDSGLEVAVSIRKFDLPTAEFPLGVYHPATQYREITEGKVGGLGFVEREL